MTKDEMKNRISMALTDPILQQGFEIICKDLAELQAYNKKLLQSDIDKHNKIVLLSQKVNDLQKKNAELTKDLSHLYDDFDKMFWKKNEIISNAKEIIKTFLAIVNNDVEYVKNPKGCKDLWKELCEKAEQFLKE